MGLVKKIDPADALLFSGLASLTAAGTFVHIGLGLAIFGLGAMFLGLMAGRSPKGPKP